MRAATAVAAHLMRQNPDDNREVARFETLDPEIRGVLGKKVSELGLRVEGSPVQKYVDSCTTSSIDAG